MTDISSHRPALDLKGSRVETWYVAEPMRVFHDYSGTLRTHLIVNSFCQREDYHISETTTTIKWCFTRVKVVSTYFTADSINRCDKKHLKLQVRRNRILVVSAEAVCPKVFWSMLRNHKVEESQEGHGNRSFPTASLRIAVSGQGAWLP